MKTRKLLLAVGLISGAVFLNSCADKNYYETIEQHEHIYNEGALIFSDPFEVKRNDFVWNAEYNRFEYIFDYEEITDEVYENGVVHASVFIWEKGSDGSEYETQKTLSYVREYIDPQNTSVWCKELISADISPTKIGFFVSGLKENQRNLLLDTYYFKVSVVWSPENVEEQARIPF